MRVHLENVQIVSYQLGAAGDSTIGQTFMADPVGSLRRKGFTVPPAVEPTWRQLATALQTLERLSALSGPTRSGGQTPYLEIRIPVGK
jgi:hypothetical protein